MKTRSGWNNKYRSVNAMASVWRKTRNKFS